MKEKKLSTLCAHGGWPRRMKAGETHVKPLYQNSVFDFPSIETSLPALQGDGYVYRRCGTPNADDLGSAIAVLEGGAAGLATTSGMAAIAAATLAMTGTGDHVFIQLDAYGGTREFFREDAVRFGLQVHYVNIRDRAALQTAFDDVGKVRVLMVETISNPLLYAANISMLAEVCEKNNAKLIVDNTFATPIACRPLGKGAHMVVHSATKFLGGHHDLSAGVLVGSEEDIGRAGPICTRFGLRAAPLDAWLAIRGLRTLEIRMRRSCETAVNVAHRLRDDGIQVNTADNTALLSFDLGDAVSAHRFARAMEWIPISPSLGGVTTTLSHPSTSSHRSLTPEEREAVGIGDGLLRLSLGVEDPEDIYSDLHHARHGVHMCNSHRRRVATLRFDPPGGSQGRISQRRSKIGPKHCSEKLHCHSRRQTKSQLHRFNGREQKLSL